ncbi:MAG: hypothetical protein EB048_02515 [Gammaproteobacteria bacterium]|nr:hypothetical protein [Gammaproteobacteria bacterium]
MHLHQLDEMGLQTTHRFIDAGDALFASTPTRRDLGRQEGFRSIADFGEQLADHALGFAIKRCRIDDAEARCREPFEHGATGCPLLRRGRAVIVGADADDGNLLAARRDGFSQQCGGERRHSGRGKAGDGAARHAEQQGRTTIDQGIDDASAQGVLR